MSMTMDDSIKRWTAKRKTALVIEIIQGKTTVAEASRSFDLSPSEIEGWIEDAKRGMENSLRANPLDIREQYEKQLKDLQEAYGEAMLELRARIEFQALMVRPRAAIGPRPRPKGGRELIRTLHEGLLAEGISVPLAKLYAWFGVPRRTIYDNPTKAAPKVDSRFADPIKAIIEAEPSFGYQKILRQHGFRAFMSGKGNCYANAAVVTFFKIIKAELSWRRSWATRCQAKMVIFEYINGFCSPRRLRSALG
jgi:transposase-like protein